MTEYITKFKNSDFNNRKEQALEIIKKYPERCPIIVFNDINSNLTEFKVHKFLVPKDLTVSQFIHTIRNRNNIDPKFALFAFINDTIPSSSQRIGCIYKKYKDEDYYLYIKFTSENTFGQLLINY
tara:strand:+ start:79 stop:453 length:375 start_codon:yes stop_codon:yes gene_type:complete